MRRSIATVTLTGTLEQRLRAAATAGFDGVELCESDIAGYGLVEVASIAADLGLSLDVLQPFRDFEGVSKLQHLANLDRAETAFDTMEALGIPLMLVCSNTSSVVLADDELSGGQLAEIAERARARSMRVGFEALSWGSHVATFDHAYRIVSKAAHPALGIVLDSFHTLALTHEWRDIAHLDPKLISYVQIADARKRNLPLIEWSRHHRCLPGGGDFDVDSFVSAIIACGYDGTFSLEIFSDELKSLDAYDIAAMGMKSFRSLEMSSRPTIESSLHLKAGQPTGLDTSRSFRRAL